MASDNRIPHITDDPCVPPLPCCTRSGEVLCEYDDDTGEGCTCDCHDCFECDGPEKGEPCKFHGRDITEGKRALIIADGQCMVIADIDYDKVKCVYDGPINKAAIEAALNSEPGDGICGRVLVLGPQVGTINDLFDLGIKMSLVSAS